MMGNAEESPQKKIYKRLVLIPSEKGDKLEKNFVKLLIVKGQTELCS